MKDHGGRTALHEAAKKGYQVAVQLLVEQGANVAAKGPKGQTALHEAAKNGHKAVVQYLVENGAGVD
jgi:ankyrin repeat protein